MASNEKQAPANLAAQQGEQPYFPPPPPGPPPVQTAPAQATPAQPPKHPNETPIPDYNPAHPQYAPRPTDSDDDIYNSSPVDAHAPKWGFHSHHNNESDGEGVKKKNRLSGLGAAFTSKVAGPVNALANKFGAEGFLPEALDKECDKAARILRSFCKDGIYSDAAPAPSPQPTSSKPSSSPSSPPKPPKKSRALLTIPPRVIARAQGLAIFTAVRLGFQATGSSGSGILLARLPDGRGWSPPSAIQVTSIGAGFVAGVDIYDCVIVINTREALDLFTKMRLSLGSDLAVTAGPIGAGGSLDWGVPASSSKVTQQPQPAPQPQPQIPPLSADNTHFQTVPVPENQQGMSEEDPDSTGTGKPAKSNKLRDAITKPVYSYVKSRGLYAGVQIDGTVIATREGTNARFYGASLSVGQILRGEVPPPAATASTASAGLWPAGAKGLFEVLRGAEMGGSGSPPPSPGLVSGAQGVEAGMQKLSVAGQAPAQAGFAPPPTQPTAAGPSTFPPPPLATAAGPSTFPPPPTTGQAAPRSLGKADEAAAEAARAERSTTPLPSYTEAYRTGEDLPPAYSADERYSGAGGDSKR
ncbi:hypothetical protein C8A05DRAFT_34612 [Staphylotrichum tortipilum]|uniref:Ysc84 actin-binding domain-containing protein n=1 Tax=Staphylotrichum tortipilum TaxID=2831512 RepID=A0AAN6MIU6_9PEZI|nr:hypothetical protein C8A05DRAFT_34612 [Staphylotrichum longicolle]